MDGLILVFGLFLMGWNILEFFLIILFLFLAPVVIFPRLLVWIGGLGLEPLNFIEIK